MVNHQQKGEGFPGQRIVVLPRSIVAANLRHPLLRGLIPTDVGIFPHAAGHLRERAAGTDQAIFIYCAKGRGWCELGGKRHEIHAGDLLVLPPSISHAYGADEAQPWTILWAHAAGANVPFYLRELDVSVQNPVIYIGEDSEIGRLFEELVGICENGYTPAHLVYASQTLAHLIGAMIWRARQAWRGEPSPQHKISQSITYMRQHLDGHLRVRALAAMVNLSCSHYTALFKKETGYAPIEYLIRLRMQRACQLLDNTASSVKEIAAGLGYDDAFYFSRLFKLVNEVSPSDYRRMHKG